MKRKKMEPRDYIFFVIAILVPVTSAQEWRAPTERPACVFADRARSLRCRRTDLRSLRAALREVVGQVDVVEANGCDLRVIPFPILIGDETESAGGGGGRDNNISSLSIVNSGLEALSEDALTGFSSHLRRLDLSGNRLTHLPTALLGLVQLAELDLSNNRIKQLPHGSAFNGLNKLVKLDLALNFLGQGDNVASPPPPPPPPSQRRRRGRQISHSGSSSGPDPLSLLAFNLEPLTDTLEELILRSNHFQALPSQLKKRDFARLRKLDLSHNNLGDLPSSAFSGMGRLEYLNLESAGLRSLALESSSSRRPLPSLRELRLSGNPLRCDCAARWLWAQARRSQGDPAAPAIDLPRCATPFSVRNRQLVDLKDTELCELLPGQRFPRFFRISDEDLPDFPPNTFTNMQLVNVEASSKDTIRAEWRVWKAFYSGSYDWGLIFREIGERDKPANATNMFYKTRHTLDNHAEQDDGQWAPANETLVASLEGLKSDTYYEVCLAAVEHSVIYYIHRKDCSEVRTPREESLITPTASSSLSTSSSQWLLPNAKTTDLTFRASSNHGITVSWNVTQRQFWDGEPFSVVRKLSYRRFTGDNVSRLYVLEDFNSTSDFGPRHYKLTDTLPATAYLVCFDTLTKEDLEREKEEHDNELRGQPVTQHRLQFDGQHDGCGEVVTKGNPGGFTTGQVAATAAASSTTVAVVAIICCCCFPGLCGGKKKKNKDKKENINKTEGSESNESKDENHNQREERVVDTKDGQGLNYADLALDNGEEKETVIVFQDDNGGLANGDGPSVFRGRYSTATLPKSSGRKSRRDQMDDDNGDEEDDDESEVSRKFWLSCLRAAKGGRSTSTPEETQVNGHHHHHSHHNHHHHNFDARSARSASNDERRRHSSPAVIDGDMEEDESVNSKSKKPKKPKRQSSPKRKAPLPPLDLHHPHNHHHHHHHPDFLHHHLHSIGPGSYHTISSYQACNRPIFPAGAIPMVAARPAGTPDSRAAAAALLRANFGQHMHHHHHEQDYSKTLGRRRRESPMASVPPPPQPVELKAFNSGSSTVRSKARSTKSRKSDSSGFHRNGNGATDNYKMYTWSPYSDNNHQHLIFQDSDYQYRLREPMLGGTARPRRMEELRF